MIILGCIRHITNFSLEVELPGLTFGYVHITNISDIFTKHLSNILEENEDEVKSFIYIKLSNVAVVIYKINSFPESRYLERYV